MSVSLGTAALAGLRNGLNTIDIARLERKTEGEIYNAIGLERHLEADLSAINHARLRLAQKGEAA